VDLVVTEVTSVTFPAVISLIGTSAWSRCKQSRSAVAVIWQWAAEILAHGHKAPRCRGARPKRKMQALLQLGGEVPFACADSQVLVILGNDIDRMVLAVGAQISGLVRE
jgi:hypothetical protein